MRLMKKYNHFRSLFFSLVLIASFTSGFGQSNYVKKYKKLADSLSRVYQIPSGVILGVAIIESGSGTSKNCRLLNNHFGLVGKNNLLKTKGIKTRYKQYATDRESFYDFVRVISNKKYYHKLKGNPSCKAWIIEISKQGYSEAPAEWVKNVMGAIRKQQLQ